MNWGAIGATGETIGAVAVCVTLIFLTIQLRQANHAQKTAAFQTYVNARTTFIRSLLDAEVNSALLMGAFKPYAASQEELQRFHQILHLSMTYFSSAHRLWKDGLISDEEWAANESMIAEFKGTEGFTLWWPAVSNFYTEDFVDQINATSIRSSGLERFLQRVAEARTHGPGEQSGPPGSAA